MQFEHVFIHPTPCLASPANFIYGRVKAKVLSHVTFMPVLLRPVNNFLGQVMGNASEGKYNTVNNSSSGEVTFQKGLNSWITLFSSKNSNKSQTFATGAYQRLHGAQPRLVVWLWEPEYPTPCHRQLPRPTGGPVSLPQKSVPRSLRPLWAEVTKVGRGHWNVVRDGRGPRAPVAARPMPK